jgi:hypothetical protein
MILHESSREIQIAMVALWLAPYVIIAASTRSLESFGITLFRSVLSPILFALTFICLWLLISDFRGLSKGIWSLREMLAWSLTSSFILFSGPILVTVATTLRILFRPGCDIASEAIIAVFHLFSILNMILVVFD